MARFSRTLRRRTVHFSDHALDRWWERDAQLAGCGAGRRDALRRLDGALDGAQVRRDAPPWARLSLWHRARADMFVLAAGGCFVVVANPSGDLVATTFLAQPAAGGRARAA